MNPGARRRCGYRIYVLQRDCSRCLTLLFTTLPNLYALRRTQAELTHAFRSIRPSKSTITTGSSELDVLHPSNADTLRGSDVKGQQMHKMVLDYSFDIDGETDKDTVSVVPRVAQLHWQLYDSPLESLLWRLADSNGSILAYGGLIHDPQPISLTKGTYKLSMLLRHPDTSFLDKLKNLPVQLRMKLKKNLECSIYKDRNLASSGGYLGKPVKEGYLRRGSFKDLYVAAPTDVPKTVKSGDVLVGSVTLDTSLPSVTRVPLAYEAPDQPIKAKEEGGEDDADKDKDEKEPSDEEKMEEDSKALKKSLLDAQIKNLAKLRKDKVGGSRYYAFADPLLESDPDSLPLLLEVLSFVVGEDKTSSTSPNVKTAGEARSEATR